MLKALNDLKSFDVQATDDEVGSITDFYFEDDTWKVRHIVVDVGNWFKDRKVLVPPSQVTTIDSEDERLHLMLSKEAVEKFPEYDIDKPYSENMVGIPHPPTGAPNYWTYGIPTAIPMQAPVPMTAATNSGPPLQAAERGDPHLRSVDEVCGYHVEAQDGEIGHVEDFLVDPETWLVRYFIVDTRNWLPGRKVIVPPTWAKNIAWSSQKVSFDLRRSAIESGPEYDSSRPLTRADEVRIFEHYGQPKYWV